MELRTSIKGIVCNVWSDEAREASAEVRREHAVGDRVKVKSTGKMGTISEMAGSYRNVSGSKGEHVGTFHKDELTHAEMPTGDLKHIKQQITAHKKYMKDNGIRRTSFMNGGLSREEQQANEKMFLLESKKKDLGG